MVRVWRCLVLGAGLFGMVCAAEPAVPRRMALKVDCLTKDAPLRTLLPGLTESLRAGMRARGIEPVFGEHGSQDVSLLRVFVDSHGTAPGGARGLEVIGWLPPADDVTGQGPGVGNAAACAIVSREEKLSPEVLNQAAQAVLMEVLRQASEASTEKAEPKWVTLPKLADVRVDGKDMKLEGTAPPLEYPWEAREARVGGLVSMDLRVDRKGRVIQACVTEGARPLVNAALGYVANLRFQVPKDLEARAPLAFGLSLRYGLPPISRVSRTVVEAVNGSLKEPGLQPELAWVTGKVSEMLIKEGVQVLSEGSPEDRDLHHLRITVETLRGPREICIYAIRARLSNYRDRSEGIKGDTLHPVIWAGLVVGQRGETGSKESLLRTLQGVVRATLIPPHPEKPSLGTLEVLKAPRAVDFDFSAIKIKHQPPAPSYPEGARQHRIQGEVVLSIEIGEDGLPLRVVALKGPAELVLAAVNYALDWTFMPALVDGKPVKARFKLTMPFRLR